MTTALERQRIQTARHAALRNRLISEGLLSEVVDRWIDVWGDGNGDPTTAVYWEAAWEWIQDQAAGGRRPGDGTEPAKS